MPGRVGHSSSIIKVQCLVGWSGAGQLNQQQQSSFLFIIRTVLIRHEAPTSVLFGYILSSQKKERTHVSPVSSRLRMWYWYDCMCGKRTSRPYSHPTSMMLMTTYFPHCINIVFLAYQQRRKRQMCYCLTTTT